MNLIDTIEEFDPGHFNRRRVILEDLRSKLSMMGFFPLLLSWNDVECFWITLEPDEANKGKKITIDRDSLDWKSYVEALKEVAKYHEVA